jgi:ribonuclease HI
MVTINIDGAARGNPGPAGYGFVAVDGNGDLVCDGYGYIGEQTNNVAEYCALLAALELARKKGWTSLHIRSDSLLLVRQIQGSFKVKNEGLQKLHRHAARLIGKLRSLDIEHVDRKDNRAADKLANRAVDERKSRPRGINPFLVKGR